MKRRVRIVVLSMLILCACSRKEDLQPEPTQTPTSAPVVTIAPEDYVVPDFTEEEILDLTDEEILAYGELIKQRRLVSVEEPNYLIEEFRPDTYQVGEETKQRQSVTGKLVDIKSLNNYNKPIGKTIGFLLWKG